MDTEKLQSAKCAILCSDNKNGHQKPTATFAFAFAQFDWKRTAQSPVRQSGSLGGGDLTRSDRMSIKKHTETKGIHQWGEGGGG